MMKKGNVLVIGNSGVGKSTLINAVMGENVAVARKGIEGTTKKLEIFEDENIPFRIIDSVGFEPTFRKRTEAMMAVKKWSRDCAKAGQEDNQINMVWLCVDGTSGKVFPDTIKNVGKSISMWKDIPVVVVITKSYSITEREENKALVYNAMAATKGISINLKSVIPVVASPYIINESSIVPPDGVPELIEETNKWMPEGVQSGSAALDSFIKNRRRGQAQAVIGAATTAAVVVGAVPIPFADAALLVPTETAEIEGILRAYGIKKDIHTKALISGIIEAGTISNVARTAVSGLKAIPYIDIAASAANAIIAGVFACIIGESTVLIAEKIVSGELKTIDISEAKKIVENGFSKITKDKENEMGKMISDNSGKIDITKVIRKVFGRED